MSNLEINKGDDFIIALDISGSMGTTDCPGGLSRFSYTQEQLKTFATEAAKLDDDGVSLYAFGAKLHSYPDLSLDDFLATLSKHQGQLEPATQTHLAIRAAWEEHKSRGNTQTFLILFTDGEPSDPVAVEKSIMDITNEIADPSAFRIAIITVGERSAGLNAWLTALDDTLTLKGAKHDIVDVKKLEEVDFLSACAGALVD